jgi:hypothetical protein
VSHKPQGLGNRSKQLTRCNAKSVVGNLLIGFGILQAVIVRVSPACKFTRRSSYPLVNQRRFSCNVIIVHRVTY